MRAQGQRPAWRPERADKSPWIGCRHPPGKRCADRLQCVSGKEKPAAAWEIADKPAVLRRAYLVASLRVTPSPFLLAVPRLAMPNMCDGHPECTSAATERHRWPLRRRGHRTARATLHQRAGRTPQSRLRAPRTRQRRYHPGHLPPRDAGHAGGGRGEDRRGTTGGAGRITAEPSTATHKGLPACHADAEDDADVAGTTC
jgi:hypothetical protein